MQHKQTEENKSLNISVAIFEPLVMKADNRYIGFEIDLWEQIAKEMKLDYTYSEYKFSDVIPTLIQGKADVALAGITINEEREKSIDFSHRTFDSGLHILVREKTKSSVFSILESVFTKDIGRVVLLLLGFVFIAGNVLWLVERGSVDISNNYFPGVFDAFWWAVVTVSAVGYGDVVPYTWLGRIVGIVVILSGLAIFGLYIARISSSMTIKALKSDIASHRDLLRRVIATVEGSTSVEALKQLGARVITVKKIEQAYSKLENGQVEAVVFDAPVLLYYAANKGAGKVCVVGDLFEPQSYGIALREGSELREQINRLVLRFREQGYYDKLYRKWFGG